MRIAVLDENNVVTNIIVADESVLPGLGITLYKVLADDEMCDIGAVLNTL